MKHGTTRHTRRMKCGELGTTILLMLTLKLLRKEPEDNKYVHENPEAKRQFSRPARLIFIGNLAEIAAGLKSLREDGDNLIDFRLTSNLEAMLREFLVLILLFSYYFHFLNVQ
ncbi:hypothetical protein Tco_0583217 [Tanacetum coccineum]